MAQRVGIMLPYGFSEKRFNALPKPCIVQPKLKGGRSRFANDQLLTSSAAIRNSVPLITEELRSLGLSLEFDGECYIHGIAETDINGIVSRTTNLHPDHTSMQYFIYDIVGNWPQRERLQALKRIDLSKTPHVFRVPSLEISSLEEFYYWYKEFLDLGYEGIIARHPTSPYLRKKTTALLKHKPFTSDSFEIVGWEEEISIEGRPKNALGALIMKTLEGQLFNTGTGFTRQQREDLWQEREKLLGCFAKIRYESLSTSRGVPEKSRFENLI